MARFGNRRRSVAATALAFALSFVLLLLQCASSSAVVLKSPPPKPPPPKSPPPKSPPPKSPPPKSPPPKSPPPKSPPPKSPPPESPPPKSSPPPPSSDKCPSGSILVPYNGVPTCVCAGAGEHWVENTCQKVTLANADYLDLQNEARAAVGSPSLVWNPEAASACESFLLTLAKKGCAYEDPPLPYPWGNNMGAEEFESIPFVVGQWLDEGAFYHLAKMPDGCDGGPKNITACAHYTQVVWKTSTSVGCASNVCNGVTYVCCDYSPPGNIIGEYPY